MNVRAVVAERLGDVRMPRRALEDHVLQQMRHAGLAVTLLPRADQHGHVDRHLGLRLVGKEQRAQAVVELVFGDALDRRHLLRRIGRQARPERWQTSRQQGEI